MAQQNNPFYVDPTGGVDNSRAWSNLNRGISALGSSLDQKRKQDSQALAKQQVTEAFQSGDNDKIAESMIKNPEYASVLKSAIGYKSEATEKNAIDSAMSILSDPDNAESVLANRIQVIADEGGDPTESIAALRQYREDPESFKKATETFLALHDPKSYKSYKSATTGDEMTPYQKATLDLRKRDQGLREQQLKIQNLRAKASAESNDLRRQQIEQQIKKSEQDLKTKQLKTEKMQEDVEKEHQEAIESTNGALEAVDSLLNHPGLSSAVGATSLLPTMPGSDSADFEALMDNFVSQLTMDNMGKMKGVLSDTDIKIIKDASGGLSLKMSEDAFKNRLLKIRNRLKDKIGGGGSSAGMSATSEARSQPEQQERAQNGNYSSLWGD